MRKLHMWGLSGLVAAAVIGGTASLGLEVEKISTSRPREGASTRTAEVEKVLFKREIAGERVLRVVKGEVRKKELMAEMIGEEVIKNEGITGFFSLRLEIQGKEGEVMVIGARVVPEVQQPLVEGFEVADVYVDEKGVFVATLERGMIYIWHIKDQMAASTLQFLRGGDWSRVAVLKEIDTSVVSVKLGRNAEKVMGAVVEDLRPRSRNRVEFVLGEKGWVLRK